MNKRIRINFNESSKAVNADVTIELGFEPETKEEAVKAREGLLQESMALFNEAQKFAKVKTMQKI